MIKNIVITLLEEGILEEDIHRILDLIEEEYEISEAFNGKTGWSDYDDKDSLNHYQLSKRRTEMSPDEYINKSKNLFRRKGESINKKRVEQGRSADRSKIEEYKKKIQDPNSEIDEPYLKYNQQRGNRYDDQEGLHRAVAAKELGMKKIPVHIIHPTEKKSPQEKREKKWEKIEGRKEAGFERKQERDKKQQEAALKKKINNDFKHGNINISKDELFS